MEINISVVIVTWNNENDIEECLNSILDQTFKNYYVIVVDNNSTDKTVEIIKQKFPQVTLLEQKKNLYLTGGNNLGIKYAFEKNDSPFVMVLNPDTKVESNLLETLYESMSENPEVGAVGPKVKFYKNKDEGKINSAGILFDGFKQAYDIGFMQKDDGQFDSERFVFGVTGACILYRSKMLKKIGLYSNQIKLYLDEVELFIRAEKAGWKVLYNPKATIFHKYMISTSQEKIEKIEKIKKKAWLYIAKKHYPLKSKLAMYKQYLFN